MFTPHVLPRAIPPCLVLSCLAASATAQLGNAWVTFAPAPAQLSAGALSDASTETDLAWADADGDGWTDVVVARKEPYTTAGKRANVYLHNEAGVLTDRTAQFASAADVPGDQGFLTRTNDRDIAFVDVDGDGLQDIVTAVTTSSGDPKHIGHPRVYRNLGPAAGAWLGFRFENARVPQLLQFASGLPHNPRFMEVAPGDVTGDGFADLFFADHDSSGLGGAQEPVAEDLDNRLLVNDGTGSFSDQSQLSMPGSMQISGFVVSARAVDLNGDCALDVLENETAFSGVSVFHNAFPAPGTFGTGKLIYTLAPYYASAGDLNNDGRPDVLVTDDGSDRYLYNTGNDSFGKAQFAPAKTFQFLSGSDEGFGSNNLVVDLDRDGWNDAIICDVDVEIPGCARRLHVYHNPGGTVGAEITLVEERELAGTSEGPGWVGVAGMLNADLEGTHDVAVLDVDLDGDLDLLVSRCAGTALWANQTNPSFLCQPSLGFAGPGAALLTLCGQALSSGSTATLRLSGTPPLTTAGLAVGLTNNPVPILGGLLVPSDLALVQTVATDGGGVWQTAVPGGAPVPTKVYFQMAYLDLALPPHLFGFTNAIEAQILP